MRLLLYIHKYKVKTKSKKNFSIEEVKIIDFSHTSESDVTKKLYNKCLRLELEQ